MILFVFLQEAVQFEVNYKDTQPDNSSSSYSDIDMKPKEAWVMDLSDPAKLILQPGEF